MVSSPNVWVVRGGDNNELAAQVKVKHAVAIGGGAQSIAGAQTRDAVRLILQESDPAAATSNWVGQLFRFAREIADGDYVLTPEKATRTIHISRAAGPYHFDPSRLGEAYPHVRPVEFLLTVSRDVFPLTVRNTLGSVLTVFRADIALPYVEAQLGVAVTLATTPAVTADVGVWADDIAGQAAGQILELIDNVEPYALQSLVVGLLQAMGYVARVGPKGKDGGVDFVAHPDPFGLESPRIKGQVKNQRAAAGIQDVGYLNGVLSPGESGLFVCTGGFTKDALTAPFVGSGRVALVDGKQFLELILEH